MTSNYQYSTSEKASLNADTRILGNKNVPQTLPSIQIWKNEAIIALSLHYFVVLVFFSQKPF